MYKEKKMQQQKRLRSSVKLPEMLEVSVVYSSSFSTQSQNCWSNTNGQRISSPREQMMRAPAPDIFNLHLEIINKSLSIKYMAQDDVWRKWKFSSAGLRSWEILKIRSKIWSGNSSRRQCIYGVTEINSIGN